MNETTVSSEATATTTAETVVAVTLPSCRLKVESADWPEFRGCSYMNIAQQEP